MADLQMALFTECRACGGFGHLAHYCPNSGPYVPSGENIEWLAMEETRSDEEIVRDLYRLVVTRGWLSRIRLLCKLCVQRPELHNFANQWRSEDGDSLLTCAIRSNLRNTVQLLWASGIACGIDHRKQDNYFTVMKMCDAIHHQSDYDWFTGKGEFAARLEREGGMIDAEVRVSLMWNCTDDLDLHIICPSGEEILYSHKKSECDGELDVDMNASDPYSRAPVENIVWGQGNAPAGEYKVIVNNYCHRSRLAQVPFTVEVAVGDRQPIQINGSWQVGDGEGNRAEVYTFEYDPAEENGVPRENDQDQYDEDLIDQSEPIVANMNKLAGTNSPTVDKLSRLVWIVLRERSPALLDVCMSLGLHDPARLSGLGTNTRVSPQWCFLQALWAKNLPAAQRLLDTCGKSINVNHKYRWDVIPWDETAAQMCWRQCHGNELHDRLWMRMLAWLACQGADFSQVKLNFHRWRKPSSMQESQIRTFDRLIWHLSDENGWRTDSQLAAKYLSEVVRKLTRWGVHIPEDLDPNFHGAIEWGVNGRRPANACSYCYGSLDVALVHFAVQVGRTTSQENLMAFLCSMKNTCPQLHSSTKCLILSFLYPNLGRGRLSYAALQRSEGGMVKGEDEPVNVTEDSVPPPDMSAAVAGKQGIGGSFALAYSNVRESISVSRKWGHESSRTSSRPSKAEARFVSFSICIYEW
eukprot:CAMPEP_0172712734 /NCGR_PEP_ID=MMETSP1074-20121228/61268_1 /TAXON_ID=2916 /ORGANISM="Ceratium fusus, Strain PA161109" /LENGTH=693 /DNA_ID=CAMNT_0013536707 /DNA_START=65 /DNA_END=2144 /DNA_ORIENTATION=-